MDLWPRVEVFGLVEELKNPRSSITNRYPAPGSQEGVCAIPGQDILQSLGPSTGVDLLGRRCYLVPALEPANQDAPDYTMWVRVEPGRNSV